MTDPEKTTTKESPSPETVAMSKAFSVFAKNPFVLAFLCLGGSGAGGFVSANTQLSGIAEQLRESVADIKSIQSEITKIREDNIRLSSALNQIERHQNFSSPQFEGAIELILHKKLRIESFK